MLRLTNFDDSRCKRWCAIVVLLAVSALTVSVATRYTLSTGSAEGSSTMVQKHSSPELSRQRLLKNAAVWVPPVIASFTLSEPSSYPRIAPAGPPIPGLLLETSLYNRPPPSALLFS